MRLSFTYEQARQVTVLRGSVQEPPLRVVHAFPQADGGALLHLHNLSGGVLGGDELEFEFELGPGARAQLTTTSATRIYRCRPGVPPARQTCVVRVGPGALLEYVPDQLIPFAGASYQQSTRIELAEDAGLFWWETLAPGRLARGECFAYELLQSEMSIFAAGLPVACERFKLEPRRTEMASVARLGPFLYHSSFFICRVGLPTARWSQLEQILSELACQRSQADGVVWGVSTLVAHGLLVRGLSRRGSDLAPGLLAFWRAAKDALYAQEAVPPRKIY
ncbi:MAG TPA: urease accessory protein UreD [Ktedonobacteraceae bacterium]